MSPPAGIWGALQKSPLHARLLRAAPAAGGSDSSWRGFGGTGGGRTCEGTVSPAVRQREGVAEDRTPKCLTAAEGAHRNGCVSAHRCREAARTLPPPDSRWAPRAPGAVWKPGRVGHAISRRPAHVLRGTFQTWTARRLRSPNSGPRPPRPENRGSQTSARLWDPREESGHRPGHLGLIPDVSHPGRVLDRISRIQAWYQACEVFCFCVPGAHAGARTWTRGPSAPNACCLWPPRDGSGAQASLPYGAAWGAIQNTGSSVDAGDGEASVWSPSRSRAAVKPDAALRERRGGGGPHHPDFTCPCSPVSSYLQKEDGFHIA